MESLKTFDNLKEDRQEEILLACLEEFARKGYENASLSSVIQRLGLAKGSFYRYFENKKALYQYLLNYVFAKRLKFERGILDGSVPDFFEMIKLNFAAKIKFDTTFPVHAAFMDSALNEKNSKDLGDVERQLKTKILDTILKLMDMPIYADVFREDLSKEVMAWQIMSVNMGLYEFINWKNGKSEGSEMPFALSEEEILDLAEQMSSVLKKGIIRQA